MKSLSDDITLKVETTDISQGYIDTDIYANDTLVFRGQAYLPGDDSPLEVNINDIASQNRGKYDYLKLNDDGVLTSTPMMYNTVYGNYRFNKGQIGTYEVTISNDDEEYTESETIIAGYDYPNKDLKPTSLDTSVSSLCRIMQGCDWIYNHDEEIGSFNNLLLPHYPYIATEKYGMGLQLWGSLADRLTKKYELQCGTGSNVSLGTILYVNQNSDSTFLTLKDLVDGFNIGNIDNDTSIYLKLAGASEDEFGDWVEGYTYYPGEVKLSHFIQKQYNGSDAPRTRIISRNAPTSFKTAVETYITQAGIQLEIPQEFYNLNEWDAEKITNDQDTLIYYYSSRISEEDAQDNLDEYDSYYTEVTTSQMLDRRFTLTPIFASSTSTVDVPTIYYGTCPVAILDRCYSRYYLAWMDRYGDVMSQPFNGKPEYTEKIENSEVQDYKLRRRVVQKQIQPIWKLNTGWIKEDIYPMYEAMFTSPYLLLYDTQTDRSWNVILTNTDYKEKTYKTERSLINLEITLEANKKQNYIF